jgi:TorA maturation chaperone TorD
METKDPQHNVLKGYNMLLYFAGTMIMYEPSEECLTDFWKKGMLEKLPVSSSNPNFIKAASQLRNSCFDSATCGKMLREDFNRLFTNQELSLAPVFESFYTKNIASGSGSKLSSVSEFYDSYGWKSKFKAKIKDDHLAIELLFLTRLIDKYLVFDDKACRDEMKNEILRYIDNHILSWVPEWNEKIQLHSNTLSFKGIGTLILACTEDIFSLFNQKSASVFKVDNLKN